jgi:hypothetical protein
MGWISVSDHLPPNDEPVLAWGCGFIEIGWYDQEDKLWYTDDFTYDKNDVTHWTPLPEPPKE